LYPDRPIEYIQGIICIVLGALFFFNPGNFFNFLTERAIKCLNQYAILKTKKKEDKGKVLNNDTYFNNSNSLELLGF